MSTSACISLINKRNQKLIVLTSQPISTDAISLAESIRPYFLMEKFIDKSSKFFLIKLGEHGKTSTYSIKDMTSTYSIKDMLDLTVDNRNNVDNCNNVNMQTMTWNLQYIFTSFWTRTLVLWAPERKGSCIVKPDLVMMISRHCKKNIELNLLNGDLRKMQEEFEQWKREKSWGFSCRESTHTVITKYTGGKLLYW